MDPMVVDVLVCQDGDQCSDRTLLADAVGAEALFLPVIGRAICGGCVPYGSDVIQSVRCSLMAERLFGGFGVRLLVKVISRWLHLKLKIINCKAAAWSVEAVDEIFRNFVCPVSTHSGHIGIDICEQLAHINLASNAHKEK